MSLSNSRVIVIGTSAGGLDALRTLIAALPPNFPAPIAIVMHTAPQSPGVLAGILARIGRLPAVNVTGVERLTPGTIYVAAPDCHMVIEPGRIRATKGPNENRFRPAIDPLFRSAGQVYGPGAIGVILTGNLDDGTVGLWTIKRLGGIAIVQDPADALCPSMPASALSRVDVDHQVPLTEVAPLLVRLTAEVPDAGEFTVSDEIRMEIDIASERHPLEAGLEQAADPSPYACPECHGVLLQVKGDGPVRFRCHTGHAYSVGSLMAEVDEKIAEALWNAIRTLEEAALLRGRLSALLPPHAAGNGNRKGEIEESRRQADAIRAIARERARWHDGHKE
ncbi:MAG: CheB methylesterase [Acidobacteria bacterium]|nr:CheB methylesterase [Acidobacteriota bacterium]